MVTLWVEQGRDLDGLCRNGIEVGSQYQTIEDVLKKAAEQNGDP